MRSKSVQHRLLRRPQMPEATPGLRQAQRRQDQDPVQALHQDLDSILAETFEEGEMADTDNLNELFKRLRKVAVDQIA